MTKMKILVGKFVAKSSKNFPLTFHEDGVSCGMNIFVLSECPQEAAEFHNDRHCVKMVLESLQILCSVFHLQGIPAPYRLTHKNHPSCRWSRESKGNFEWLLRHSRALCGEYTRRYGKRHKSEAVLNWVEENKSRLNFEKVERTPFAQAMPDEFRNENAVTAYRNYYLGAKRHLFKWKTKTPEWVK